jgi:hypothetical protein
MVKPRRSCHFLVKGDLALILGVPHPSLRKALIFDFTDIEEN